MCITTTKPYISSSNYVIKMSNYKKDNKWDKIWDNIYYYFVYINYEKLTGRSYIYKYQWNNKTQNEQNEIIKTSKKYIITLTKKNTYLPTIIF